MQRTLFFAAAVGTAIALGACDGTGTRFADPPDVEQPPDEQVQLRELVLEQINTRTRDDAQPLPVNDLDFVVDDMPIDLDLVNAM